MKILGDDVYIQRGENWSLDFEVTTEDGTPYTILKEWKNPFLAISVTAARYSQEGDYRHTWWLDLSQRYVEQNDGTLEIEPLKKFISTEALYLEGDDFSISEILAAYGTDAGGRIVANPDDDFDLTNFLFYIDPNRDGNRIYKYCKSYESVYKDTSYDLKLNFIFDSADNIGHWGDGPCLVRDGPGSLTGTLYYCQSSSKVYNCGMYDAFRGKDANYVHITSRTAKPTLAVNTGNIYINSDDNLILQRGDSTGISEKLLNDAHDVTCIKYPAGTYFENDTWEEYSLRIVKTFDTKEWVEQGYLYDIKVLCGELVEDSLSDYLASEGKVVPELPWSNEQEQEQIERIENTEMRTYYQEIFDSGMPLMPDYDTKLLVLMPTRLYVSANIQKGV